MNRMREVDEKGKSADFVPEFIDERFLNLISEKRPKGEWFS
jgi:hypothetical protein